MLPNTIDMFSKSSRLEILKFFFTVWGSTPQQASYYKGNMQPVQSEDIGIQLWAQFLQINLRLMISN